CTDDARPAGVYFGTSSGHLFASADAGDSWQLVAGYLPRILSVTAVGGRADGTARPHHSM
ncbi:MAG TPA: hypothetical protein VK936_08450, partial [Longimicrobiales bacterium]|nr:hypothetical protein [Longimicrobiales bacterium]